MEKTNNNATRYQIYTDILAIFKFASEITWNEIRTNSIYRIMYLSSVLHSFRYSEKSNPFSIYKFSIDSSGPYDSEISESIIFLVKDEYLKRANGEDVLALGDNRTEGLFKAEQNEERIDWIKQVVYILGIYGENKIYDFIFRDPQYQLTIKSNTQQGLNIDSNNKTIETLKEFQKAFEESLKGKQELSTQKYLELYFEYVFSKILKREN